MSGEHLTSEQLKTFRSLMEGEYETEEEFNKIVHYMQNRSEEEVKQSQLDAVALLRTIAKVYEDRGEKFVIRRKK